MKTFPDFVHMKDYSESQVATECEYWLQFHSVRIEVAKSSGSLPLVKCCIPKVMGSGPPGWLDGRAA